MKLQRRLLYDAIRWEDVISSLVSSGDWTPDSASLAISRFRRGFSTIVQLRWFRSKDLSDDDNCLLRALCQLHGCDEILLEETKERLVFGVLCRFKQQVLFLPSLRGGDEHAGSVWPVMEISVGPVSYHIRSLVAASGFFLLVGLLGVVLYVLSVGLLLYGISVLLLFFALDPTEVLTAVTSRADMLLALLCVLMGLAGVSGKALRNIVGEIRRIRKG